MTFVIYATFAGVMVSMLAGRFTLAFGLIFIGMIASGLSH